MYVLHHHKYDTCPRCSTPETAERSSDVSLSDMPMMSSAFSVCRNRSPSDMPSITPEPINQPRGGRLSARSDVRERKTTNRRRNILNTYTYKDVSRLLAGPTGKEQEPKQITRDCHINPHRRHQAIRLAAPPPARHEYRHYQQQGTVKTRTVIFIHKSKSLPSRHTSRHSPS